MADAKLVAPRISRRCKISVSNLKMLLKIYRCIRGIVAGLRVLWHCLMAEFEKENAFCSSFLQDCAKIFLRHSLRCSYKARGAIDNCADNGSSLCVQTEKILARKKQQILRKRLEDRSKTFSLFPRTILQKKNIKPNNK